jgi:hypothetical protein
MSTTRSRRNLRSVFFGAFLFLSIFTQASPLFAQDAPPDADPAAAKRAEASARFKRGTELFKEENYEAALVEFRRSYELTDEYRVLYNIAQVCYQLRDYVCAARSFESYLVRGGDELTPERQREVGEELVRLRGRIGTLEVVTSPPGADVTIDNVARGKTPLDHPVALSAGKHHVNVSLAGKIPVTRDVEIAGAETRSLRLELADASVVIVRPPETATPSKWTTLSFVGLAAAGVLTVGAGVTGILALDASSELSTLRYVGEPTDEATSQRSRVVTFRTMSDVLAIGAVGVLATTLILTLTRDPTRAPAPPKASRLDVHVGPRDASVAFTF